MVLVYLGERFIWRTVDFLRHWYVKSLKIYSDYVFNKLERLDRILAWKITLKNLFSPLYKDYTLLGYVLGFILRFARLIVASAVYAVVFFFALALYVVWLLIPLVLVAMFLGVVNVKF